MLNKILSGLLLMGAMIFWMMKMDSYFRYSYDIEKKKYPGFLNAYFGASILDKFNAVFPFPIFNSSARSMYRAKVIVYNVIFVVFLVLFFIGIPLIIKSQ